MTSLSVAPRSSSSAHRMNGTNCAACGQVPPPPQLCRQNRDFPDVASPALSRVQVAYVRNFCVGGQRRIRIRTPANIYGLGQGLWQFSCFWEGVSERRNKSRKKSFLIHPSIDRSIESKKHLFWIFLNLTREGLWTTTCDFQDRWE